MKSIQKYLEEANVTGKKTIAIDLDRTMHTYEKGWHDGTVYGDMIEGTLEAVKLLHSKYRLIVFTARISADEKGTKDPKQVKYVIDWLDKHGLSDYFSDITNVKTGNIIAIIDDRAVHFNGDWKQALKDLQKIRGV